MTISLPPLRELPADVKERMRPAFTEASTRRSHTPLAVAAAVALLIAGGVAVTHQMTRDADPADGRVVSPSGLDVDRCRAALNDRSWSSSKMVVFGLHKVLVGDDGRFCGLTRSRAIVMSADARPLQMEAGSLVFRSENIIAGVPPLGARQARARELSPGNSSRGSTASVVTPEFFVTYAATGTNVTEMVFDDRTIPVAEGTAPALATKVDSFDSGDGNPWTPANLLARCVDNADRQGTPAEELQGWEPLISTSTTGARGMSLAHLGHRKWATCTFSQFGADILATVDAGDPDKTVHFSGFHLGSEYTLVGRTNPLAKTIELYSGSTRAAVVDVADGFFIATVPVSTAGTRTGVPDLQVIARSAKNEIVYLGGLG